MKTEYGMSSMTYLQKNTCEVLEIRDLIFMISYLVSCIVFGLFLKGAIMI